MKVVVVGAGNGGCFTALHWGWYTRNYPDIEVEPTNAYEAPRFGQEHPFGGLTYEQQIEARRNK